MNKTQQELNEAEKQLRAVKATNSANKLKLIR